MRRRRYDFRLTHHQRRDILGLPLFVFHILQTTSEGKERKSAMKRCAGLILSAVFSVVVLVGCAGIRKQVTRSEVPENRQVLPQTRTIKSFTPEITITKTVGETMIERERLQAYPGFELTEALPPASRGLRWECRRSILIDGDWCYWCSKIGASTIPENPPVLYNDLAINRSGEVIGVVQKITGELFRRKDKVIGEKFVPVDIRIGGSYRHELIYNGKSKDTIWLSYREYMNETARFFQTLTYDLSESREIAFRDLRIEVLEATNSAIKFIVKK